MPRLTPKKTEGAVALLTVADVARLDNVCEKTIRRAIDAELLEVVRVGPTRRGIRIDPAAHAAYRRAGS